MFVLPENEKLSKSQIGKMIKQLAKATESEWTNQTVKNYLGYSGKNYSMRCVNPTLRKRIHEEQEVWIKRGGVTWVRKLLFVSGY